MTIIEHIKEVLVQLSNSGTPTGKFHYVNKNDATDIIRSLEDAFERKVDLSQYEKREIFIKTNAQQVEIITGSKLNKIPLNDILDIQKFYHICRDLSKQTEFHKLLKNINTKISRNKDYKEDMSLRYERVMLYLKI